MLEEKKIIPYKVQKGNRPKIKEVFEHCLYGELRKLALNFAQFMDENEMKSKLYTSTTRSQVVMYKKEPICNINVYAEDDWNKINERIEGEPQSLTITLRLHHYDEYKNKIVSENLNKIKWDTTNKCQKNCLVCCYRGIDRVELNAEFADVCWRISTTLFDYDNMQIDAIKRLLLLEKQARENEYFWR